MFSFSIDKCSNICYIKISSTRQERVNTMRYTIQEIKDSYEHTLSEKDEKIAKLEKQVEALQKQLLAEKDEKQIIRQFFDMAVTLDANGYLPDMIDLKKQMIQRLSVQ